MSPTAIDQEIRALEVRGCRDWSSCTVALVTDLSFLVFTKAGTEYMPSIQCKACAVLCCAVLCCAVLCCAVLCCAVLCCPVALSFASGRTWRVASSDGSGSLTVSASAALVIGFQAPFSLQPCSCTSTLSCVRGERLTSWCLERLAAEQHQLKLQVVLWMSELAQHTVLHAQHPTLCLHALIETWHADSGCREQ